jgi:hypothetical protein
MRAVYATATTTVALPTGIAVSVQAGTHWSAEDPVVRAHPELFSDDPRHGMLFSRPLAPGDYPGADESPVEQATAGPGEKRTTRRG